MESPVYSLAELNRHIRETIEDGYPDAIWVSAEIAAFNRNSFSGHCYLDLVDAQGEQAKIKAMIWKKTFDLLASKFEYRTSSSLRQGIKVQFLVKVEFNIQYGLSLIIWDVDPDYTLGEIARQRALTIKKLEDEGLLQRNKGLSPEFPILKIAIISSPTAAGYQDFVHHLETNPYGFVFHHQLFPAIMQGNDAIVSIEKSLKEITSNKSDFQAIIIIRGGGSTSDLQVFDSYELATLLAKASLPVLSGIGHQRDESVCDLVAWQSFKTPTAVADWLIEQGLQCDYSVRLLAQEIAQKIAFQFDSYLQNFQQCLLSHSRLAQRKCESENLLLLKLTAKTAHLAQKKWFTNSHELEKLETTIKEFNPLRILEKGYARVSQDGKWIKSKTEFLPENEVRIQWKDGQINIKN